MRELTTVEEIDDWIDTYIHDKEWWSEVMCFYTLWLFPMLFVVFCFLVAMGPLGKR